MKRLSKNFISIIGSDIARRVLGFFAIAYLARKIGLANFGAINVGFAILSYALTVSSVGLSAFGARAIARGESSTLVNIIVTIRLISSSGAFILVSLIAIFFIPNDRMVVLVVLFCLSLFPYGFLIDWYFQGKERMGVIGVVRLVSAAVYLMMILIFVRSTDYILWVAIAAVVGDTIASGCMWIYYRTKEGGSRLFLSLAGWRSLIRQAFPIGSGSILSTLSVNLPPLVIGIILSNSEVGIFTAASKLVLFLLMLDRVIGTLLLPASSRIHAQSADALSSTLSLALKWILVIALPICIGGTILGNRIIPFVFGSQYVPAVDLFRILIWFFFFTMLHTVYTSGMIAVGKEKTYAWVMMISVIIYAVSIIVSTLLFGTAGAAAAVVVSEATTVLYMRQLLRQFLRVPIPRSFVQIFMSAIIMGCVVIFLPTIHVFIVIVAGAIVYSALLFLTRGITINDVSELLKKI